MTNKPIKRWSALVIREIQIKSTMRNHYTPTKMANIKNKIPSVGEDRNPDTLLVGL